MNTSKKNEKAYCSSHFYSYSTLEIHLYYNAIAQYCMLYSMTGTYIIPLGVVTVHSLEHSVLAIHCMACPADKLSR